MAAGDPMWRCPFCMKMHYAAVQTACNCDGWNRHQNPITYTTNPPQAYCGYCGTRVPGGRLLCDVCGEPYSAWTLKPEYQNQVPFPNTNFYTVPPKPTPLPLPPERMKSELEKAFEKLFTDPSDLPKQKEHHPDVAKAKEVNVGDLYEDLFSEKIADEVIAKRRAELEEREQARQLQIEKGIEVKREKKSDPISDEFEKFFSEPQVTQTHEEADLNTLYSQIIEDDRRGRRRETEDFVQSILDEDRRRANERTDLKYANPPSTPIKKKTLVVNLFAGPGAGKSTTAAGVFFELKSRGINCELAAEFAKDLTWEERHDTFKDQIYIFGKQYHRIFRLLGKVDVIITDSPLLLTPVYDGEKRRTLHDLVVAEHKAMWTYNVFLKRKKKFNPKGRIHGLEEARALDLLILDQLNDVNECYECFEGTAEGKDAIVKKILSYLEFHGIV